MNIRKIVLLVSVLLAFVVVGISVINRERLLSSGETFLFELIPVDPRSIMQGDYMELSYKITRKVIPEDSSSTDSIPSRGYIIFKPDSNNVAQRVCFQKKQTPLISGERQIKYFTHSGGISIGSGSYFFQEGDAKRFEGAKYGGIKVAKNGSSILWCLYNSNFERIK
ncbi:MAG: GDYXXLXY domain-containing protein [Fibrobacter sp.]|nr:GDYXXLXY domain-containing protein [Fibrobacter sp.]